MTGKMLVKLLFLLMISEVLLFSVSEAKPWWRRRRRRPPPCDSSSPSGITWANTWHQNFRTTCPTSSSLTVWRSEHRNCKEDRIHHFQCRNGPFSYTSNDCAWSDHYVNDFDRPVTFQCPYNGVITGVRSEWSGHHRDRRFDFRCCHRSNYVAHSCKTSVYQNHFDQPFTFRVPGGYWLVGVRSHHDNVAEDRRWEFEYCKVY